MRNALVHIGSRVNRELTISDRLSSAAGHLRLGLLPTHRRSHYEAHHARLLVGDV